MKINYLNLENCAKARGTVIVIDVLRAFSTAAYAFEAGAEGISLVSGVDEALSLRQQHPDWLVMGEEGGLPPQGFDFGNSPTQIRAQKLNGRHLIQRTSAGTQGVARSLNAEVLVVASFVIASATVQYVLKSNPQDVSFVITGGENNEEDLACAEYLEALFQQRVPDPEPFIRRVYESPDAARHLDPAHPEFPEADVYFCTRIDAFHFALPVRREDGYPLLRPTWPAV